MTCCKLATLRLANSEDNSLHKAVRPPTGWVMATSAARSFDVWWLGIWMIWGGMSSSKDFWGMFLFVSPHSLAHDEVGARKYQTKSSSPSTLCRLLHKKHILYYHMAALSKQTQGTPLSRRIEELLSSSPRKVHRERQESLSESGLL